MGILQLLSLSFMELLLVVLLVDSVAGSVVDSVLLTVVVFVYA